MTITPVPAATLDLLNAEALGSGKPIAEQGGDARGGEYWLLGDNTHLRLAIKVALITGRPLLLLGPSGTGKSSLARAIAETLRWRFYDVAVTSQTRLDDLTGSVDLVRRLHEAQLAAHPVPDADGAERRRFPAEAGAFMEPGRLWWAFAPTSAAAAGRDVGKERADPGQLPSRGPAGGDNAVLLIDEIDKAEPDVPNNLLIPLGSWELKVPGREAVVVPTRPHRPLVVITSNEEREMPPAFLRRCIEFRLGYLTSARLTEVAAKHVPGVASALIAELAKRLIPDGQGTEGFTPNVIRPPVSTAEFIDAVRAAHGLGLHPGVDDETFADLEMVLRHRGRRGR